MINVSFATHTYWSMVLSCWGQQNGLHIGSVYWWAADSPRWLVQAFHCEISSGWKAPGIRHSLARDRHRPPANSYLKKGISSTLVLRFCSGRTKAWQELRRAGTSVPLKKRLAFLFRDVKECFIMMNLLTSWPWLRLNSVFGVVRQKSKDHLASKKINRRRSRSLRSRWCCELVTRLELLHWMEHNKKARATYHIHHIVNKRCCALQGGQVCF